VAGAACWSALHISIGAALGEAAKRLEGTLNLAGFILLGSAALAATTMMIIRRRRRAKASVDEPELEPVR
jgi:membrane-associated protein